MFFASVCNSRSKYRRNSERVKERERVIELLICLRVVGRKKGRRFSIKSLCSREKEKKQTDNKILKKSLWWWLLPWNCDCVCVFTRSNWNSAVVLNVTFLVFFSSSFLNPVSLFILHLVCFRSKRFCSVLLLFCLLGVVPCQKCCECRKKKEKNQAS